MRSNKEPDRFQSARSDRKGSHTIGPKDLRFGRRSAGWHVIDFARSRHTNPAQPSLRDQPCALDFADRCWFLPRKHSPVPDAAIGLSRSISAHDGASPSPNHGDRAPQRHSPRAWSSRTANRRAAAVSVAWRVPSLCRGVTPSTMRGDSTNRAETGRRFDVERAACQITYCSRCNKTEPPSLAILAEPALHHARDDAVGNDIQ
jgi:hypothetical protein